jgi:FtsH-binding integral membrane protein
VVTFVRQNKKVKLLILLGLSVFRRQVRPIKGVRAKLVFLFGLWAVMAVFQERKKRRAQLIAAGLAVQAHPLRGMFFPGSRPKKKSAAYGCTLFDFFSVSIVAGWEGISGICK